MSGAVMYHDEARQKRISFARARLGAVTHHLFPNARLNVSDGDDCASNVYYNCVLNIWLASNRVMMLSNNFYLAPRKWYLAMVQ